MKIVHDVEICDYKVDIVIGIDPGSKNTGVVVVENGVIVSSFSFTTSEDFYSAFAYRDAMDGKSVVVVFERPFAATNIKTYSETNQIIGYIKGMFYFLMAGSNEHMVHLFVSPSEGNDAIGLHRASTHDIAKMNMAKLNGWTLLKTAHEVSAYAAVLAAESKGGFEWIKKR